MHVPTCESSLLDIVSLDDALASSGGRGDYDAEKWLYVPDYYTDYRYILGTRGSDPLICIGINPSTAAPDDLDNTLKSVSRIAARKRLRQLDNVQCLCPEGDRPRRYGSDAQLKRCTARICARLNTY